MATTLPLLDLEALGTASSGGARRAVASTSQLESFAQAMNRADQPVPGGVDGVSQVAASSQVTASGPAQAADDQARARQALELGGPAGAPRVDSGDAILGGMQKLRGVFDASLHKISEISGANVSGVEMMIDMQREMVHYSLLLDVTSKLTGKTTQAVDQLMKGQ